MPRFQWTRVPRCVAVVAWFLGMFSLSAPVQASGWNDYKLEIAPGFAIYKMNAFEVCLGRSDDRLLLCPPLSTNHIGPLVGYSVTEDLILIRHEGARPHDRNPSMKTGDPTKEFFYIVSRESRRVEGPLSRADFDQHPLKPAGRVDWQKPRNPNLLVPLLGGLFFLGVTAVLFGWPLVLVALVVWWFVRRRSKSRTAA